MDKKTFKIIDAHAHMGPYFNFYIPFNNADEMVHNMDLLNIEAVVFSSNAAISSDVIYGNNYTLKACLKYPDRYLGYFVVNPNYPELMKEEIEKYFKYKNIVGFKIHPELAGDYPMNGNGYRYMWEYACENNLPVLSHTYFGGDKLTVFDQIAKAYPDCSLIIGHGGFDHGLYQTIELCNNQRNLYLDLCPPVVEKYGALKILDKECDENKILFGTDAPWNEPSMIVGSLVFADIDIEKKKKWLRYNFFNVFLRAAGVLGLHM